MHELIKLVSREIGLSEEMAEMAVETVLDYVKREVPSPIAYQIDLALANSDPAQKLGHFAQSRGGIGDDK